MKIVVFDEREDSPTRGHLDEFHVGEARPTVRIVPPGVWHGVQNLGGSDAVLLNCPSDEYDYEDPDHWRVDADCPHIPYSWDSGRRVTPPAEPASPRPAGRATGGRRRDR